MTLPTKPGAIIGYRRDGRPIRLQAGGVAMFNLEQLQFRGRNDNGTEVTAGWKEAANTNWSQGVDENFRVRFVCQVLEAAGGSSDMQLQYNLNGAGWNNVTTTSTVVKAVTSGNVTDGTATTDLIGGTGTFNAGTISTDGLAASVTLSASGHTEWEFVLQIVAADVVNGNTIELRGIFSGDTTPVYTATPSLTVSEAAGTNANAEDAAATGTANNPTIAIAPTAGVATATGTANNATYTAAWVNAASWDNAAPWNHVTTGTDANAGTASTTGTAYNPSVAVAPAAGIADATGTSNAPSPSIAATTSTAAVTGTGYDATNKVAPTPATADGTGTANNPTVNTGGGATNAPAEAASGTGVANNTTSKVSPTPPSDQYLNEYGETYWTPAATGFVYNPSPKVAPVVGTATGTGTANNPTVLTGTVVNPGLASATGTANNPSPKVAPVVGAATGTGIANNATAGASVNANAGLASGTGTANNPTLNLGRSAMAEVATGTGTAYDTGAAVAVLAEAAAVVAAAFNASIPAPYIAALVDVDSATYSGTLEAATILVGQPS